MSDIEVLTQEEAAEYLRVSVETIARLVLDGKIPGRDVGNEGLRLPKAEVRAYLYRRRMGRMGIRGYKRRERPKPERPIIPPIAFIPVPEIPEPPRMHCISDGGTQRERHSPDKDNVCCFCNEPRVSA